MVSASRELDLKFGREGHIRTCYSLRCTYIGLHLLENADIHQVANNCRISAEMTEEYYARPLTNTIDASAVLRARAKPAPSTARNKAATATT